IFLTRAKDIEGAGRAHGEVFADVRPATTAVVVAALLDPRWLLEIEAEALVSSTVSPGTSGRKSGSVLLSCSEGIPHPQTASAPSQNPSRPSPSSPTSSCVQPLHELEDVAGDIVVVEPPRDPLDVPTNG